MAFVAPVTLAQPPTNEQIETILAEPPTNQQAVCFGSQRSMQFDVCAQGPIQRIALAARQAKKEYRPFTLADVTSEMRENLWLVFAAPSKPIFNAGQWIVTPAAKEALFQSSGQKDVAVVRPVRLTIKPASWGNALGAKFTSAGFTAFFNPADLPAGQLDLIILTAAQEQRYALA
ncbi:MAG: hypothetical protein ACRD3J_28005, partial [Thermoanaerobaculia bacterium]